MTTLNWFGAILHNQESQIRTSSLELVQHQHAILKWDYPQEVTSKVCVCVSVCTRIWAVPVVMLRLFHSYLWSEEYCYNLSSTLFNLLLNVDNSSSLFTLPTWGTVCTNCSKVGSGGGCRFGTGLSPGLCCSFICKIEMRTHTYMELCCLHWTCFCNYYTVCCEWQDL